MLQMSFNALLVGRILFVIGSRRVEQAAEILVASEYIAGKPSGLQRCLEECDVAADVIDLAEFQIIIGKFVSGRLGKA